MHVPSGNSHFAWPRQQVRLSVSLWGRQNEGVWITVFGSPFISELRFRLALTLRGHKGGNSRCQIKNSGTQDAQPLLGLQLKSVYVGGCPRRAECLCWEEREQGWREREWVLPWIVSLVPSAYLWPCLKNRMRHTIASYLPVTLQQPWLGKLYSWTLILQTFEKCSNIKWVCVCVCIWLLPFRIFPILTTVEEDGKSLYCSI